MSFIFLLLSTSLAQESGGRIESHFRLGLSDCSELVDCEWLDLRDSAVVGFWTDREIQGLRFRADLDIRLSPMPSVSTLDDTQSIEGLQPLSIRLRDAWMDLPIGESFTTRIGVQTISWGVADGVHVSDPVNPWNLENPLALDQRLSIPALHSKFAKGRGSIEAVAAPFFTGSVLPHTGLSLTPSATQLTDFDSFAGNEVGHIQARLRSPPTHLAQVSTGLHATYSTDRADFGLTAYSGRDSLPQAHGELLITGFQTDSDRIDFAVPLIYPKRSLIALDARGELAFAFSGWFELALNFPESTVLTASRYQLDALVQLGTIDEIPDPLPTFHTQDGEPFTNWIVGIDRPFDSVYISLQWLHGFPTERQAEDLSDYLMLYTRTRLSDNWVLEIQGLGNLEGQLVTGSVGYLHEDSAELFLEGAWSQGTDGHSLESFSALSHLGIGAKLPF